MCPKNPINFNVDNVRVAKLLGGGLHNSTVVRGMVLKNDAVGTIKRIEKAKVSILYIWDFWGFIGDSTLLYYLFIEILCNFVIFLLCLMILQVM